MFLFFFIIVLTISTINKAMLVDSLTLFPQRIVWFIRNSFKNKKETLTAKDHDTPIIFDLQNARMLCESETHDETILCDCIKAVNHIAALDIFVSHNYNINFQNTDGMTLLHSAMFMKKSEGLICYLLENGANPNIKDSAGDTALHIAVRMSDVSKVNILLNYETNMYKIDRFIKNNQDKNPLEIARVYAYHDTNDNEKIIEMLQ